MELFCVNLFYTFPFHTKFKIFAIFHDSLSFDTVDFRPNLCYI
mgnify:CR=1 FL=1